MTYQEALAKHGTKAEAARQMGLPVNTFKHRLATELAGRAVTTKGERIVGRSTLTDAEGNVVLEWTKTAEDKNRVREEFGRFVEEASRPLKGLAPFVPPPDVSNADLLAVYPIGDHHHGMRADPDETGDAYDCKISGQRLETAVDYLCHRAPPAKQALLLNLGDYYHINDSSEETPASGNKMDADNRFGQVFDSGAMNLILCVLRLLEKHEIVHVWNMRGNHDPDAAAALSVAMAYYFHAEPRVIVDRGTSLFKFMRFGKNLIGSHHGHGTKSKDLPLLMAVDRKKDWAETDYRVWHVGHFHHRDLKEYPGCDVEIHRTLAGTDAWHHGKGYRSRREMQLIVYHRKTGEAERTRFDPAMLAA